MQRPTIGVQLHCLRHLVRQGLAPALEQVVALGLAAVELNYLPGCRGNPWGDFGAAADLPPHRIAAALHEAGLSCPSVMVNESDLAPDRVVATLEWVAGIGAATVILTALRSPANSTLATWRATLDRCAMHADVCRRHGLAFGLHTQPDLWNAVDGQRPLDLMPMTIGNGDITLEYDPTGALLTGADPAEIFELWAGPVHAVHLRDGRRPEKPMPYLPALPLGEGSTDWPRFLSAADGRKPSWYFLEMEVARQEDVVVALRSSLDVCRTIIPGQCPMPS